MNPRRSLEGWVFRFMFVAMLALMAAGLALESRAATGGDCPIERPSSGQDVGVPKSKLLCDLGDGVTPGTPNGLVTCGPIWVGETAGASSVEIVVDAEAANCAIDELAVVTLLSSVTVGRTLPAYQVLDDDGAGGTCGGAGFPCLGYRTTGGIGPWLYGISTATVGGAACTKVRVCVKYSFPK